MKYTSYASTPAPLIHFVICGNQHNSRGNIKEREKCKDQKHKLFVYHLLKMNEQKIKGTEGYDVLQSKAEGKKVEKWR